MEDTTSGPSAYLRVRADEPSRPVSPLLYGIFYEDVNHAADGGLYAELIRNRSFEDTVPPEGCTVTDGTLCTPNGWKTKFDDSDRIPGWQLAVESPATGAMHLDDRVIINAGNPRSLRLEANCGGGGCVSVVNLGFWGIRLDEGARYRLSLFVKTDGAATSVTVSLRSADGTEYACETIDGIAGEWAQYGCRLTSSGSDKDGRLVITTGETGVMWFDVVSLFPEATWNRRENGLRPDLMGMLAGLMPAFLRFPGGCVVEGFTPDTAFRWKNTIGPIHERKGHWNLWGYRTTNGLGFHEYLQMCEDLGAAPMYVVNCGMTCQARNGCALPLDEWLQDALDAIEYANGPAESRWGAIRAQAGHPEPFGIKFIEIGNENFGPDYETRYLRFWEVLNDRHPEIRLITNAPVAGAPMEILDEHYYPDPSFFLSNWTKYDGYDRKGPGIYVGEYACTQGCGKGNLAAAIGEAGFMVGMERNADVVTMSSYAPLFVNVNDRTWNPDAINFDNTGCYGTPSYHVQAMFAQNRPDEALACEFTGPVEYDTHPVRGGIGLSTWATTAEFRDVRVTNGDQVLYASDFPSGDDGWRPVSGDWTVVDGAYRQTSDATDTRTVRGDAEWTDYTLSLKARKLVGAEGFRVMFRNQGANDTFAWMIGCWSNTAHFASVTHGGAMTILGSTVQGSIETDRWYDVRIEVEGRRIRCFLDDALIHDTETPVVPMVVATAGRSKATGEITVKVVNASCVPQQTEVRIDGIGSIAPIGTEIILTSDGPDAENSLGEPTKVAPVVREVDGLGARFIRAFEPYSVTILRLRAQA